VPRSARLCLYALALIGLVAGTASIVGLDRKITVAVDGQFRDVVTSADTVQGALRDADLTVGAHDVVAPATSTPVHAGRWSTCAVGCCTWTSTACGATCGPLN
jgi:uncharacterized protein YabE (DUF348 family)